MDQPASDSKTGQSSLRVCPEAPAERPCQHPDSAVFDDSDSADAEADASPQVPPIVTSLPELGLALDDHTTTTLSSRTDSSRTAQIAANAPRYRRKSSTFIDAIHDTSEDHGDRAPAQLYSTMSGRLFHSGRIAIVMVGLPARGKT